MKSRAVQKNHEINKPKKEYLDTIHLTKSCYIWRKYPNSVFTKTINYFVRMKE